MFAKTSAIAKYSFITIFRNKIFWILVLFGVLVLSASVLFSVLGQEQEIRMLVDLGLASIEILTFIAAVFIMVNLILEEIDSRAIYLILTRSVSKGEYLIGKFAGAMGALFVCFVMMTVAHLAVLLLKGWKFEEAHLYFLSVFMSFEKIILISALTLFFSLFSSSAIAALIFSVFFWILGHFALELRFLSNEVQNGTLKTLFKGIYLLIPHFEYLNARDLWVLFSEKFARYVVKGTGYTAAYTLSLLLLALLVFRKKEF